jgi:methionyl-tRNA formyltransferase
VKTAALEAGIRVIQPERVKVPAFLEALAAERPDVLVVVAYGRILPEAALVVAPLGAVNLHFSLLPRYRGAAPVQWALARGEEVTGVTTMLMSARLDEGDILLQRDVRIEPAEHAPALTLRLAGVGASLLAETLGGLAQGTIEPRPQDPALATWAPPLRAADGEMAPDMTAAEIEGRVRGFDPWPGVWVRRESRRIRIVEARALEGVRTSEPAGTVLGLAASDLALASGGGTVLAIRRIQPEGRRAMSAREALNGRHVAPGDRFDRLSG